MPDWGEILIELQTYPVPVHPVDVIRRKYLKQLHNKTGRNVIAYYSAWLQRSGTMQEKTAISDEDKNAFMTTVHKLDTSKGLDLILHTPGGDLTATESIVEYLKSIFGRDIRTIIPQIAMSAGTMIACASKEIVMGKQSNLGPIDPHFGVVPCQAVVSEFQEAIEAIKKDPQSFPVWQTLISKYHPAFVQQCRRAIELSEEIVEKWLNDNMFNGDSNAETITKEIIKDLMSFEKNKMHSRHLHMDKCTELGLKVCPMEKDNELQDLILSVHHSFIHTFGCNPLTQKIVESHEGKAMFLNSTMPNNNY